VDPRDGFAVLITEGGGVVSLAEASSSTLAAAGLSAAASAPPNSDQLPSISEESTVFDLSVTDVGSIVGDGDAQRDMIATATSPASGGDSPPLGSAPVGGDDQQKIADVIFRAHQGSKIKFSKIWVKRCFQFFNLKKM
jgi:hypothetical protein